MLYVHIHRPCHIIKVYRLCNIYKTIAIIVITWRWFELKQQCTPAMPVQPYTSMFPFLAGCARTYVIVLKWQDKVSFISSTLYFSPVQCGLEVWVKPSSACVGDSDIYIIRTYSYIYVPGHPERTSPSKHPRPWWPIYLMNNIHTVLGKWQKPIQRTARIDCRLTRALTHIIVFLFRFLYMLDYSLVAILWVIWPFL